MGKKRVSLLGTESEEQARAKHARQLEQKKLRQGKTAKAPGLGGGQRVVDTSAESLAELEEIEKRTQVAVQPEPQLKTKDQKLKTKSRSRSYVAAKSKVDPLKTYSLPEALPLLRQVSLTKFDPTVELHLTLKAAPANQIEITLPHSSGKSKKVVIADDATVSAIESGKIDFDILLASPAQMGKLVKLAKVLGPRGLMPNPKNGTLVENPESAIAKFSSASRLSLRADKDTPVIHTVIGKLSGPDGHLSANIQAVITAIGPGQIRKTVLKSTMSPAIKVVI